MEDLKPLKLTLEDGQRALGVHVVEKGHQIHEKYGKFIDYDVLLKILKDEDVVRFPTRIVFDSSKIEEGMFGYAEKVSKQASDGYVIYIHEHFKKRQGDLPALVFYHLISVNYGDFATCNEAEEFASAALGMDKEKYYQYICQLVDSIPKKGEIVMVGGIGLPELVVVFMVILLLFGAKALPDVAKGLAQAINIFKKEARNFKQDLDVNESIATSNQKISTDSKDTSNDFKPEKSNRDWRPKTDNVNEVS